MNPLMLIAGVLLWYVCIEFALFSMRRGSAMPTRGSFWLGLTQSAVAFVLVVIAAVVSACMAGEWIRDDARHEWCSVKGCFEAHGAREETEGRGDAAGGREMRLDAGFAFRRGGG